MKFLDNIFSKKTDHRVNFASLLFYMSLGLIPWCSISPESTNLSRKQKSYFLFVTLVIAIWVLASIEKEIVFCSKRRKITVNIFDIIATTSMACTNLYTIFSIHFWKCETYKRLLSGFVQVDEILYKYIARNNKLDIAYFFKTLGFKLVLPIMACVVHTYFAASFVWYIGTESLQKYHMLFTVTLVQHYINQISHRYEAIGRIMAENLQRIKLGELIFSDEIQNCLDDTLRALIILSGQVNRINNIYGLFFLLLMVHSITSFLYYFQNALILYKLLELPSMIVLSSWSWLSLSKLIVLATTSMSTYKTIKSVGGVCYDCLHVLKFSRYRKSKVVKAHERQILTLICSIYLRPPVYSVGRVFNLDNKWLFIVINATITYLIVVLYF